MEVCGTHSEVISKNALRQLYTGRVKLISGPGCPVCVIPPEDIDLLVELARRDIIIVTFGDLIRVPGTRSSLAAERAQGRSVKIVYSPWEALDIAMGQPSKAVVFAGVGFETTAPLVAVTMKMARQRALDNFGVLCLHRTMPAVLRSLFQNGLALQGLLLPGHVCAITGTKPFEFLPREFGISAVISGFTPEDVIQSIETMRGHQKPSLEIQYRRAVPTEGNMVAQNFMEEVFEPRDAAWRGFGVVKGSGLAIKEEWSFFDACRRWGSDIALSPPAEESYCRCGDIMRGLCTPLECPLYKISCDPYRPQGPCMVSGEGACAIYYRYGG